MPFFRIANLLFRDDQDLPTLDEIQAARRDMGIAPDPIDVARVLVDGAERFVLTTDDSEQTVLRALFAGVLYVAGRQQVIQHYGAASRDVIDAITMRDEGPTATPEWKPLRVGEWATPT